MATKKRVVKKLNKSGVNYYGKYHGNYVGNEPWNDHNLLNTELKLYKKDWEDLGKPDKIRVTISVIND